MQGGPNWVKNFVDAPIIADHANKVIYKQVSSWLSRALLFILWQIRFSLHKDKRDSQAGDLDVEKLCASFGLCLLHWKKIRQVTSWSPI